MLFRVLILIFMMILIPATVNAADFDNDFEVEILPAEGQKNFSEGFFHLDSEPGEKLSLDFRVTNNSGEPIRLNVQAVDAHTADEGGILYDATTAKEDHVGMAELIDIQESVSIAAGAAEIVHFHIAIPDDASGTMLGGIMLTSLEAPENLAMDKLNKGESNYTFEQPGQQLMAVKVNLPKTAVHTGFSVDGAKFDAPNNRVTLNMKNGDATVLESVEGTYTVMDKEGEILLSGVMKPFAMAPGTDIDYPVDLNGLIFGQGKYVLMIKGRADEKEFFAEEKFTVTETEAAGVVSPSTDSNQTIGWGQISRIFAVVLAALLLLLPMLMKFYNRNEKKALMEFSEKNNL